MSLFKSITLLALALPMAACTQTIVEEAAPEAQKGASYSSPGKGGAAVHFSHEMKGSLAVGEYTTVKINVSDNYADGTLTLQATGSQGLTIYEPSGFAEYSMDADTAYVWNVDVKSETDGVYYLNVSATATPEGQTSIIKTHSIRVEIGDMAKALKNSSAAEITETEDGEKRIIMEAEEEIIQN